MSLLTENVIPGNHGKIFGTNAIEDLDLLAITVIEYESPKINILSRDGIQIKE